MLRMLRCPRLQLMDKVLVLIPILLSLVLLYIIFSIVIWGGSEPLLEIISSNEVFFAIELSLLTSIISTITALIISIL